MDIILYLLQLIQLLYKQNCWLLNFICKYLPLKQWVFDDSHSPKYQKFKIDELPKIISIHQGWDYNDLIKYYKKRYSKEIKPVNRRSDCDIPEDCSCPRCSAPICYDVPMQFISAKVDIRFLPDDMDSAYILMDNTKFPIRRTNRNENAHVKRNNVKPAIDYSKIGGIR